MRTFGSRSSWIAVCAVLTATVLVGCGGDDDSSGGSGASGAEAAKIAFLMPDTASTRYELADKPLFEKRLKELCPGCSVLYQNADSDAAKQQQQVDSALAQGVKAIVLDPVDSAAAAIDGAEGQVAAGADHRLRPADPEGQGRLLRLVRQREARRR